MPKFVPAPREELIARGVVDSEPNTLTAKKVEPAPAAKKTPAAKKAAKE